MSELTETIAGIVGLADKCISAIEEKQRAEALQARHIEGRRVAEQAMHESRCKVKELGEVIGNFRKGNEKLVGECSDQRIVIADLNKALIAREASIVELQKRQKEDAEAFAKEAGYTDDLKKRLEIAQRELQEFKDACIRHVERHKALEMELKEAKRICRQNSDALTIAQSNVMLKNEQLEEARNAVKLKDKEIDLLTQQNRNQINTIMGMRDEITALKAERDKWKPKVPDPVAGRTDVDIALALAKTITEPKREKGA